MTPLTRRDKIKPVIYKREGYDSNNPYAFVFSDDIRDWQYANTSQGKLRKHKEVKNDE